MSEKPTYEELEQRVLKLERKLDEQANVRDLPDGEPPEENAEKYRLMVGNANEAILVAQDGVFVFSNPMGETLFGYSEKELGSRPLTEFVHGADRRMVGARHAARLAGDTSIPEIYDFRIIHKSGDIRWVTLKVALFSWENRPATLCFMTDVTERKLAEGAWQESEERFRRIVETAEEGIWVVDHNWESEFVNARMAEMLGYQPEEMIGRHLLSFMDEQEQHRARELMARREQGVNEKHDFKFQRRDGTDLWAIVSTNAVVSEDGRFMHALAMITDITDRKQAEEALRISEEQYRSLVEEQTDLVARFTPGGRFHFVNNAYCKFFNRTREELIGTQWQLLPVDEDVVMIQEKLQALSPACPKVFIENRVLSGKGNIHWVQFINQGFFDQDGNLLEIQSVGRDITERKQLEEALKESEERLRHVLETSKDIIVMQDLEGKYLYYNGPAAYGVSSKDIISKTPHDFFDKETADMMISQVRQVIKTRKSDVNEKCVSWQDETLWFIDEMHPVYDAEGHVIGTTLFSKNITDRKHTEEKLKNSEERYRAIFEQSAAGITTAAKEGRILVANQAFCDMLGYTAEELSGMMVYDITFPEDRERSYEKDKLVLEGKENILHLEKRYVHKDGYPVWSNIASRAIRDESGNIQYVIGVAVDINEQKRAEAALQKALDEKVILLREVHHRVKNNMQTIIALLEMHARRTGDGQLTRIFKDCLNRITAMSLIHESLYQSDDLARIDFGTYIKKLCRNLGQAHDARRKGVSLAMDVGDVSLNMDQGIAVGMVVSELISNAFKHAFPGKESGRVALSVNSIDEGGGVEMTVSDDGAGLPADFDIRKTPSLGLKLVEATVTRELGGTIDLESDNGARFIIRFKC